MYLSSFAWSTGKECLLFVAPFKGQFNGLILLSYPWMYVFLEAVSQRLGQRPIIYCYNLSDNLLYCWKWPQKPRKYLMLAHRIKPETSRNTPPQWQSLPNVFITVTRFFTSKCFFVNFRGAKKIKMMKEEFLMFKNYVASLGIVEIRWKCNDPGWPHAIQATPRPLWKAEHGNAQGFLQKRPTLHFSAGPLLHGLWDGGELH